MSEMLWKALAEIENQILRVAAAIGLSDFLYNVRPYHIKGLCHVENGKIHRFQMRGSDSPQQVQAVVALPFCNIPSSHF